MLHATTLYLYRDQPSASAPHRHTHIHPPPPPSQPQILNLPLLIKLHVCTISRVTETLFVQDVISLYPKQGITDAVISFFIRYRTCWLCLHIHIANHFNYRELLPCSSRVCVVSPLLYQGISEAVKLDDPNSRFASLWQAVCANNKDLIAFPCNLR